MKRKRTLTRDHQPDIAPFLPSARIALYGAVKDRLDEAGYLLNDLTVAASRRWQQSTLPLLRDGVHAVIFSPRCELSLNVRTRTPWRTATTVCRTLRTWPCEGGASNQTVQHRAQIHLSNPTHSGRRQRHDHA